MRENRWRQRITVYSFMGCIVGVAAVLMIAPEKEVSQSERRRLTKQPELTTTTLFNESFMEDLEKYLLDQFPVRDGLRRIKAYFAYNVLGQKENNGIYVVQGQASKLEYPLNEASVKRLANKMQQIKEQYFPQARTCYAIVPDKNYFLAQANGYPSIEYTQMIEVLHQELNNSAQKEDFEYIDLIQGLTIEKYYHTDTHWRQEQILDTAEQIEKAFGIQLDEKTYRRHEISDFYGVYYGQAALPMEPDTIVYLTNHVTDTAYVWNMEENMEKGAVIMPYDERAVLGPVYRLDKLEGELNFDKYDVFLGGAASLQIIQSPASATDKRLIIFRDSYTSSLAPLLLTAYREITLIDLRYINTKLIGNYVDFEDADILFLYNTSIVNNSSMLK